MRLLLDEMWPPAIAAQLRRRGHDVVAVKERADLVGAADEKVFAVAQLESRAVFTENVPDYRLMAIHHIQRSHAHHGLVLTTDRRFPRHRAGTVGRVVRALDALLSAPEARSPRNTEHWLM